MTDIRFYHMERQSLEQVLPSLLTKALEQGKRIVVKGRDEKDIERINEYLWTYNPDTFLPHGSKKDGHPASQPVWLTTEEENPNAADVLILVQGAQSETIADYALCCEMLDGNDKDSVASARDRWKTYKNGGHSVTYWQQGAKGWEKKEG